MAVKRPFIASILTVGITSITAQIVLLRELIIVFYGNEVSIGLMLGCWLFFGAAGSILLGRFTEKIPNRIITFCACQLSLGILLPLLIIVLRHVKHLFGFLPGEIIPLGTMFVSSALAFAPLCTLLGFLFALGCRIYPERDTASGIGRVYIIESIGAAAGGLITSFLLIRFFTPMQILFGLAAVNIISCIFLSNASPKIKLRKSLKGLSYLSLIVFALLIATGHAARLEEGSKEAQWRPFNVIASKDSIYGNITVCKIDSQVTFFTNGLNDFTVPDILSQEEAVHFVMPQHTSPKNILLIGGGSGGLLWEILKYDVARIDYVEIDPLAISLARKTLPELAFYALDRPEVNIINTDGRFFVKNTPSRYDVIIISLPDPYTAQINRFYTQEFFKEASAILNPNGVLSFGLTSSENYISKELGNFLGSIYNTLHKVFKEVKYVPGDTAYFLASQKDGLITTDAAGLIQRLEGHKIEAGFVNRNRLFWKLSKERIEQMDKAIKANGLAKINLDFAPISYYYDMILWSTYFGSSISKVARFLNTRMIWSVFIFVYILIIISGLFSKNRRGGILTAIGATGYSEIVFQIVVILSFQIIYGYLYYKLGLILTAFMIGLFLGSLYITNRLDKIKDHFSLFIKVQAAVVLYPMFLPFIFKFVARGDSEQLLWIGSNAIFPLLPIIAGFIGGLQFPLGNRIYIEVKTAAGEVGGLTYGIDLLGACLGAIIASALLIPVLGIFQTCLAVGLLNLSVFLSLLIVKKRVL